MDSDKYFGTVQSVTTNGGTICPCSLCHASGETIPAGTYSPLPFTGKGFQVGQRVSLEIAGGQALNIQAT